MADSPAAQGRGQILSPSLPFGGGTQGLPAHTLLTDSRHLLCLPSAGWSRAQVTRCRQAGPSRLRPEPRGAAGGTKGRRKERKEQDFSGSSSPFAAKVFEIDNVRVVW